MIWGIVWSEKFVVYGYLMLEIVGQFVEACSSREKEEKN